MVELCFILSGVALAAFAFKIIEELKNPAYMDREGRLTKHKKQ